MTRTLLLITPGFIARGDLDARGRIVAMGKSVPPAGALEAGSLTLAALGLVKAKARKVVVLSTSAVTAMVEVSGNRLQGLNEAERNAALAFEAEAITGVPAHGSRTVARRLGGDSVAETWWVTQVGDRLRQEIEAELMRHGAKLEALTHPGGVMAGGVSGSGAEAVEVWEDLLFARHAHRGAAMLDIVPGDLSAGADALLARVPVMDAHTGMRHALWTTRAALECREATHRSLQDAETLQSWFSAWGRALEQEPEPLPVLHPPPRPMSTAGRVLLSALATCLAIGLCAANWWWTEHQITSARSEGQRLTEAGKVRAEIQKFSGEIKQLHGEHQTAQERHQQTLRGFGAMLEALALEKPPGVLVRSLRGPTAPGAVMSGKTPVMETTLVGVTMQESLAAQFSQSIGVRLQPFGWTVRPAKTQALLTGGTPVWAFEVELRLDPAANSEKQTP
ncbi:MAG: hypothetical protein R3F13_07890 [Prosthecobacter sp.]